MPPLPRFDRIWKSVLKQFKKKSKKCKTFALHPNFCPSNHTNKQTWNNANRLKKSSQNELSSMKFHDFQAKWPKL
jgi:predicted DNA-binding protein (MmcQ/YjbR family)